MGFWVMLWYGLPLQEVSFPQLHEIVERYEPSVIWRWEMPNALEFKIL